MPVRPVIACAPLVALVTACAAGVRRPSAPSRDSAPAASASASALVGVPSSTEPPAPAGSPDARGGETDALPPPLPAGFVSLGDASGPGAIECGGFRVELVPETQNADDWRQFVRVRDGAGHVFYEQHGRAKRHGHEPPDEAGLQLVFCGDLTGDGVPEVALDDHLAWARGSERYYVVSLTTPPRQLLAWNAGPVSTSLTPVRILPGAAWQLRADVMIVPKFEAADGVTLSISEMPYVPATLSLVDGAYQLTSLGFAGVYRDGPGAACASGGGCDDEPTALAAWVNAVASSDWQAQRANVGDAHLRRILDRRAPALRKQLAATLGSLTRPVAPRVE